MMLPALVSLLALGSVVYAAPQLALPPVQYTTARKVGDGNPHQNYLYKQVTDPISCNGGTCSIGHSKGTVYTIGFSAMGSSPGGGWFGAGFSVSESVTTSDNPSCGEGDKEQEGDTICVFWRQAHTSYEVEDENRRAGDRNEEPDIVSEPYTMRSPNNDNKGSGWVCGRDDECKFDGYEFWGAAIDKGVNPKGTPEEVPVYPFDEAWQ